MRHAVIAALLLTTAGAAPALAQTPAPAATATPEARRLAQLFHDSDEGSLRRNPLSGIFRGDLRYAAQFGDYLSDAHIAAERRATEDDLRTLAAIDRAKLSAHDQVSYDVFKWQRTDDLKGYDPAIVATTIVRPIDHFNGFHTFFPDLSSGDGVAPYKTLTDYNNGLTRIDGFVGQLDAAIARFKEGERTGVTQPKLVVRNVIGQLDGLIAQGVDNSPFVKPVAKFPAAIPAAEQTRLRAAYRAAVADKIDPAFVRLRDFLRDDYLPRARESVGLSQMPGGANLYRYLVASQTTTDLTPQQLHATGLAEVARITGELEKAKRAIGYTGTLQSFFEVIRTDPKYKPATKAELQARYVAIGKRVDAAIPRLFALVPKSPLEIRPVPDFLEKNQAAAYYQGGTPDGSRPGVFYFNTYDLPSRTVETGETLYLHEAIPGHHFQISLAQEDAALPAFQRFGGNTAYVEGWALYSESLGAELGMYTDPVQLFGHYSDEALRGVRLVVDTGIHSMGWTREQAIDYMTSHTSESKTDATAEVERYIAYPGQALAYKTGQLTIRRLRTRAETALGRRFDVRAFHARVVEDGALPLSVLEAKIDRWIAAGGPATLR